MENEPEYFDLGDVKLLSGSVLSDARLAYQTYGKLSSAGDNVVILPTFYTGTHSRNQGFFGRGRALDPERHFIVSINMFGNGLSTSPTIASVSDRGVNFPDVTLWDNIACQHRLLTEKLGIERIALVAGWSMAGAQAYQWAAQYPDMVEAILPFCASAKTSPHNFVFLEGVKAALIADENYDEGRYSSPPIRGLAAFGKVYVGWAFSQTFYRQGLFRHLGYETVEALLDDWARDHVENWDANNLLAKLKTWQLSDISANPLYNGDFEQALASITARAILIPCSTDLYFPPADNEIEVAHMPNADLRIFYSPWGHCVANPGSVPAFEAHLDACINELLNDT